MAGPVPAVRCQPRHCCPTDLYFRQSRARAVPGTELRGVSAGTPTFQGEYGGDRPKRARSDRDRGAERGCRGGGRLAGGGRRLQAHRPSVERRHRCRWGWGPPPTPTIHVLCRPPPPPPPCFVAAAGRHPSVGPRKSAVRGTRRCGGPRAPRSRCSRCHRCVQR